MAIVRLQIAMDEERLQELESLMQECGIRTRTDLINNALTLFKWAVNKRKSDYGIVAMKNSDSNHYIELDMPSLPTFHKSQ